MHDKLAMDASAIARQLMISKRTILRISERFRVTGNVAPFAKRNGRRPIITDVDMAIIVEALFNRPGIYLDELQQLVME